MTHPVNIRGTTLSIYGESLPLATDQYQLTMGQAYWQQGMAQHEAVFTYAFRDNPFAGGYAVCAGLAYVAYFVQYLKDYGFSDDHVRFLASLTGHDGKPLFCQEYLAFLRRMPAELHVDGIAEGTAVFAHEPIVRVHGPIIPCQIVESFILTEMNFQTLIATKAARICHATQGEPVSEQGLRRAHGLDGALTVSRAAYIGGCASTSNVLAGYLLGIPTSGTMAHSFVMAFASEVEAFRAYAEAMPNNCVFLVDTYNTLNGVKQAAEVGKWLAARGQKLLGIRLDSGDLAWLSQEARRLLDAQGLTEVKIFAANDLDEQIIADLKSQGAVIAAWGVGTKLATGGTQAALGGVYKLGGIRPPGKPWRRTVKLSEQRIKTSVPGYLQVRRFRGANGHLLADAVYDEELGITDGCTIVAPLDPDRQYTIPPGSAGEDLLVPVCRDGMFVGANPDLSAIRARTMAQLAMLDATIKRQLHPHEYKVGLEARLFALRRDMIYAQRGYDDPAHE
jgi:nicotinate phosphoribosyltransferase